MEFCKDDLIILTRAHWKLMLAQIDIKNIFKGPESQKDEMVNRAISLLGDAVESLGFLVREVDEDDLEDI